VYSFVSVFACWPRTYWLATAATGRQASKQAVTEGRKEGRKLCFALLACLLVRQLLSTGKLATPVATLFGKESKNGLYAKFGICQKKRWVFSRSCQGGGGLLYPQESTIVLQSGLFYNGFYNFWCFFVIVNK
jgi:hypothetical protein